MKLVMQVLDCDCSVCGREYDGFGDGDGMRFSRSIELKATGAER